MVLFDKSPQAFKKYPEKYLYKFSQKADVEVDINLLQRYIFISLDIFINMLHNKGITNKLDAWLAFLASDLPEDIIEVIDKYPEFKALYQDVYVMCLNTEKVMNMFSKELSQLDKNTVQYMIDEMQTEIDGMKHELEEKDNVIVNVINEKDSIISEKDGIISEKDGIISEKDKEIARLKRKLNEK